MWYRLGGGWLPPLLAAVVNFVTQLNPNPLTVELCVSPDGARVALGGRIFKKCQRDEFRAAVVLAAGFLNHDKKRKQHPMTSLAAPAQSVSDAANLIFEAAAICGDAARLRALAKRFRANVTTGSVNTPMWLQVVFGATGVEKTTVAAMRKYGLELSARPLPENDFLIVSPGTTAHLHSGYKLQSPAQTFSDVVLAIIIRVARKADIPFYNLFGKIGTPVIRVYSTAFWKTVWPRCIEAWCMSPDGFAAQREEFVANHGVVPEPMKKCRKSMSTAGLPANISALFNQLTTNERDASRYKALREQVVFLSKKLVVNSQPCVRYGDDHRAQGSKSKCVCPYAPERRWEQCIKTETEVEAMVSTPATVAIANGGQLPPCVTGHIRVTVPPTKTMEAARQIAYDIAGVETGELFDPVTKAMLTEPPAGDILIGVGNFAPFTPAAPLTVRWDVAQVVVDTARG